MGTKYPEIFDALAAKFAPEEVKQRPQGRIQLSYVTARTVMNRLDEVLGPENWQDEYNGGENGVLCKLSIRLPDGSWLTKCDVGGYAGMADSGDDEKSGHSDAFKRAAVKFGVARYLYKDGVPTFADAPEPAAAKPRDQRSYAQLVADACNKYGKKKESVHRELLGEAVHSERVKDPGGLLDDAQVVEVMSGVFTHHREWVIKQLKAIFKRWQEFSGQGQAA